MCVVNDKHAARIKHTVFGYRTEEKLLELALCVWRKCHCSNIELNSTLAHNVPDAVCICLCLDDVNDG